MIPEEQQLIEQLKKQAYDKGYQAGKAVNIMKHHGGAALAIHAVRTSLDAYHQGNLAKMVDILENAYEHIKAE